MFVKTKIGVCNLIDSFRKRTRISAKMDPAAPFILDGSILEGGGQLIRTALSLSCIIKAPVKITQIRQNRPKPGLAAQHLAGARLVSMISSGTLKGDEIGSTELEHTSGVFALKSRYLADCGTAGAITLLLQVSLPCLVVPISYAISDPTEEPKAADKGCNTVVEYRGGTNVIFSPPIDHTIHVFLPLLGRMIEMRNSLRISVLRRGFYPRGGGIVKLNMSNKNSLNIAEQQQHRVSAINLTDRGQVTAVRAVVFGNNSAEQKLRIKELLLTALQEIFLPIVLAEQQEVSARDGALTSADSDEKMRISDGQGDIPVSVTFDYEEDQGETVGELTQSDTCSGAAPAQELENAKPVAEASANTGSMRKRHKGKDSNNSAPRESKSRWKYEVITTGAIVWFVTDTGCHLSSNFTLQYRKDTSDPNSSDCPTSAMEISSSSTRTHPKVDAAHDTDLAYFETEGVRVAVDELLFLHQSKACVDEHTADQLLIYMALAGGESQITCAPRCENSSLHIETVMRVVSDLGCAHFKMIVEDGGHPAALSGCRRIICSGMQGKGEGKGMSNALS
jgi:RNA 3'-phosphate cyclase